jgi:fructuronate reductase
MAPGRILMLDGRRLSPALMNEAAARGVTVPDYDRHTLRPGLVHIGIGAFTRCHQHEYTEDLLSAGLDDRFVTGINLRAPFLGSALQPQDCLYSRTLSDSGGSETRIIGALRHLVEDPTGSEAAIAALADPAITVVTMTLTEKGYCHSPAGGRLDDNHADIVADLQSPLAPRSAIGVLVEALRRRQLSGAAGMTLISCDNVPSNGAILSRAVRRFAELSCPSLSGWIDEHIRFPSTMVDRIVPATKAEDRDYLLAQYGFRDEAAVMGEPFRQWVIEDCVRPDCPRWDAVGAEFVADMKAHELVKMRVLNGAQSAMSFIGCLIGLETTYADTMDSDCNAFIRAMLTQETAPTLPHVPGMEPDRYIAKTFERLGNSTIRHTNHQIATDGSQKMIQRIIGPLAERLAQGATADRLTAVAAAWIAYLAAASPIFGSRWGPQDPLAKRIAAFADVSGGDANRLAHDAIGGSGIFPDALVNRSDFAVSVAEHLAAWLGPNPRAHLAVLARLP